MKSSSANTAAKTVIRSLRSRAADGRAVVVLDDNYTHFTLEAFGSVLGVVCIFWSEKVNGSVARVPPDPPPP